MIGANCKYLFICGAIASGIGKGVMNSSIGMLLKEYGYSVSFLKIDPYLNIDAGTMNPYEHGEVFVTSDGGEVDLDIGNYERFMDIDLSFYHSLTSGKLYQSILAKERAGQYLGKTVQVIPHVVDEIKRWIRSLTKVPVCKVTKKEPEILLIEIGGTVGDMESMCYFEAVRQMIHEEGKDNVGLIMLTYILTLQGEQKTKPAQNGIKSLLYTGLNSDFIVCRSDDPLQNEQRKKLAMFANLDQKYIFSVPNVEHIYDVPGLLQEQSLVESILERLKLPILQKPNLDKYLYFKDYLKEIKKSKQYKVGIFGKYMKNRDAYMSLQKSIKEASYALNINIEIEWVDLVELEGQQDSIAQLDKLVSECDGIIVPGGFGEKAFELKVQVVKLAREVRKPFLGICYGFQAAVIDYARNVIGLPATTEENHKDEDNFVVYMPEIDHKIIGGNMRLGNHLTKTRQGSLAEKIYGESVTERHRHRYEVNPLRINILEENGLIFSGRGDQGDRMEILELPEDKHPFFIGVQYHPEFTSKNFKPNSLFLNFVAASIGIDVRNQELKLKSWK